MPALESCRLSPPDAIRVPGCYAEGRSGHRSPAECGGTGADGSLRPRSLVVPGQRAQRSLGPAACPGSGWKRGKTYFDRAAETSRADALRLDAFDARAGAGDFYARCGFTERGRVVYKSDPLIYYERLL